MAARFRLCDWLLPNSRLASPHLNESTLTPPRVGDLSDVRNQDLRARAALATQR
jgi:hypothetical protein